MYDIKNIYKVMYKYFIIVFFLSLIFNINFFSDFLFNNASDWFMDFYNSIRDAKDIHVYDKAKVIYPPLVNVFYFLLSKLFLKSHVYQDFSNRFLIRNNAYSIGIYVLFISVVIYFLYKVIKNKLFFVTTLFSMPFIYALQRGNIIIVCFLFLLIYIKYKDDFNEKKRLLADISISLACVIKIYPVLFLLILFIEKQYYRLFKIIIYTSLLFFVPFIFYGGSDALFIMINNILDFSNYHTSKDPTSYACGINAFLKIFGLKPRFMYVIISDLLFLFICFFSKRDWIKYLMIVLVILNLDGSQIIYNALYFIVPLYILFFNSKNDLFDLIGLILLSLTIFPNAIELNIHKNMNNLFYNNSMYFIIILLVINSASSLFSEVWYER